MLTPEMRKRCAEACGCDGYFYPEHEDYSHHWEILVVKVAQLIEAMLDMVIVSWFHENILFSREDKKGDFRKRFSKALATNDTDALQILLIELLE